MLPGADSACDQAFAALWLFRLKPQCGGTYLRQQIRNPQALHVWPDSKMPSFDLKTLSERDLDDLVAYLFYMAKRKVEVPKG